MIRYPKYQSCREDLINNLSEIFPHFSNLNDNGKFIFVLKCDDPEVIHPVSKFLDNVAKERGQI